MADGGAKQAYANRGDYYVHIVGLHSGISVSFPAIITSFKDNYTPKWNSENVYGRNDPIMTFQATERKIQITLEVPAYTVAEAQENFKKLSQLAASQYPGYSGYGNATTIATAPLHKIKFANWVTSGGKTGAVAEAGLVVALEGVAFQPIFEAGVIENGPKLLPKQFNLDLAMTVLHTDQVGWNLGYWMGKDQYPYTEDVDIRNEQSGVPDPQVLEFDPAYEEAYQQSLQDYLLSGPTSGGPGTAEYDELYGPPGMSLIGEGE